VFPTTPEGSVDGEMVMVMGTELGLMVMENCLVATGGPDIWFSHSPIVKVYVPARDGVPVKNVGPNKSSGPLRITGPIPGGVPWKLV